MNAPVVIASQDIDPRLAFLLVATAHHEQVQRGEETIDRAFASVTDFSDRMFPSADHCPTCGLAPCGNPSFCAACERADERGRA